MGAGTVRNRGGGVGEVVETPARAVLGSRLTCSNVTGAGVAAAGLPATETPGWAPDSVSSEHVAYR
jgi:hypothetical protein